VADPGVCPCGSRLSYPACCRPLHDGAAAATALQLMRSRYSAFALGLPDHLMRTWHPDTRPGSIDLDPEVAWRRLQIVDTARGAEGDGEGMVEFRAVFRGPDGFGVLHERSRFVRSSEDWLYLDGDLLDD
jgi:SEC-C motif-containing protein